VELGEHVSSLGRLAGRGSARSAGAEDLMSLHTASIGVSYHRDIGTTTQLRGHGYPYSRAGYPAGR